MNANQKKQSSPPAAGDDEIRVTNISSGNSRTTVVITHPSFLIVVPKNSFWHNPLCHAHRLKSGLLAANTSSQVLRANKPSIRGSLPDFPFRLIILALVSGLLIWLTLVSPYYVYGVLLISLFVWSYELGVLASNRTAMDPQQLILSRESSLLLSRKTFFLPPYVVKLSSIRFFRTVVRNITYGVEAVTTENHFSFAFGTSESGAMELTNVLNNYLRSSDIKRTPPSLLGEVESFAASVAINRQRMTDQLPRDSRISVRAKNASLTVTWSRQWILGSFIRSLVSLALWAFFLGLTLVSRNRSFSDMISNGYTVAGFALFIAWFSLLIYLSLANYSLKFIDGDSTRTNARDVLECLMYTKTINLSSVAQVQLVRIEANTVSVNTEVYGRVNLPQRLGGSRYSIVFVKNDGEKLFGIDKITEGEAMFILSRLRSIFPAHFDATP